MILSIDFETRSTVDLRETGVYPYAAHPDTEVWCMAWAFGDEEPVQLWIPGQDLPPRIRDHIERDGVIKAWNAQFERTIWREIMVPRHGAVPVKDEQWVCTMAEARAMGLPGSLDQCAQVLRVAQQKDVEGYGLMMRLTRPRAVKDGRPIWWDNAEGKLDRLYAYCKQDVRTERAIGKCLRPLPAQERELYLLDQTINDRGVQLDLELIEAAADLAAEGEARANAALAELTGGAVKSVKNNGDLRRFLNEQGLGVDSVSKPVVAELLSSDLDPTVRQVLQLRADAGRTSVAKLHSMLAVAGADGRARGLLQYHGASTGRWSGRLIQPQNFPRGILKDPEWFIPLVQQRRYDEIDIFAPPLGVISSLLRAMLIAGPGRVLVAGDFSAIEARVLNWIAGEEAVLEDFRAYDAGDKAKDPYVIMARCMSPDATRQAGKAAELGCGYQMGAKKFVTAAWDVYQVRVDLKESARAVKAYRARHPHVQQLWWDVERACIDAVDIPGQVQVVADGKLKMVVRGAYLYLVLPSGRPLCYAAPQVVERTHTIEVVSDEGEIEEKTVTKRGLEFSALDPLTKQWGRERTYGGKLVENIVQAVSRDLLAHAMIRAERNGFPIVLTVHDEIVSEPLVQNADLDEFEDLMKQTPEWAHGCPINAEGWTGPRYRK